MPDDNREQVAVIDNPIAVAPKLALFVSLTSDISPFIN